MSIEEKDLYGLSLETYQKIHQVLERFEEIEEAILYGSRAKGNHKSGSDIDLSLKGGKLNLKVLNRISLDLNDLFLPYSIDISIYHQIDNPDLIEHIQRVGKVFLSHGLPALPFSNKILCLTQLPDTSLPQFSPPTWWASTG